MRGGGGGGAVGRGVRIRRKFVGCWQLESAWPFLGDRGRGTR